METFQTILDWAIMHEIRLMQASVLYQAQAQEELDKSEPELGEMATALAAYIARRGGLRVDDWAARKRVGEAVRDMAAVRRRAFQRAIGSLSTNVARVWEYETQFYSAMLRAGGVSASPAGGRDGSVAVMGQDLGQWQKRLIGNDIHRLREGLTVGARLGETEAQLRARVIGRSSLGGRDGLVATARRELDTLVRTATGTFADYARVDVNIENALQNQEVYVAILDSRTTEQCSSLHGKVFANDKGPRPPIHWYCRSTRIPLVGNGSMRLPTYREWLERLSVSDLNEVLGPRQAQQFRNGTLDLQNFREPSWRGIDLEAMAMRERQVFEAAGMEPPFQ